MDPESTPEQWKPVVGFEGWYRVSNLGRVQRIKRARSEAVFRDLTWRLNSERYPRVTLCLYGKSKLHFVHRLVAEAFLGPCPDGHEVDHINGDRGCPRLDNLEYVTHSENVLRGAVVLGRTTYRGSHKTGAKLTEADVAEILASEETHRVLGRRFGVHHSTIGGIKRREKWSHVDGSAAQVDRG